MRNFKSILTEKISISMNKSEKFQVEEVIQAITDAGKATVVYKNKHASTKGFEKIAKNVDDILFKARREIEKIRSELIKG